MTTKVKDLSTETIEKIINKYEEKLGLAYATLSALINSNSEIKTKLGEIMNNLSTTLLEIRVIIDADTTKKP